MPQGGTLDGHSDRDIFFFADGDSIQELKSDREFLPFSMSSLG